MVDLVHKLEEIIRFHAMLGHQSTHRGAVTFVVILLQPECLLVSDREETGDIVADALVDLLPQIDMMWIERVVQIEYPGLDMIERTRCGAGRMNHAANVSRSRP